jgi:hypothetical protein
MNSLTRHAFSRRMYLYNIELWKIQRNVKGHDMCAVAAIADHRRQSLKKDSRFFVRGHVKTQKEVDVFLRRNRMKPGAKGVHSSISDASEFVAF